MIFVVLLDPLEAMQKIYIASAIYALTPSQSSCTPPSTGILALIVLIMTRTTSNIDLPSSTSQMSHQFNKNSSKPTNNTNLVLSSRDITRPGWIWSSVPIVVESHKLIFFTIPKVGSTVFKKLFRRMMGYENWRTKDPHDPAHNGLDYLNDYSTKQITLMMTSPEWTRAIFVRDPKERFLSAYLDKVRRKDGMYVKHHCCSACVPKTISGFLNLTKTCYDPHW